MTANDIDGIKAWMNSKINPFYLLTQKTARMHGLNLQNKEMEEEKEREIEGKRKRERDTYLNIPSD